MKRSLLKRVVAFFLGLLFAFLVIECTLRLVNLEKIFRRKEAARNTVNADDSSRHRTIVCIGESMTVSLGYNSYPSQLEKVLNESRPDCSFTVINRGLSCKTSAANLAELEENIHKYRPFAVVSMIGINEIASPKVNDHIKVRFSGKWWKKIKTLYLFHSLFLDFSKRFKARRSGGENGIGGKAPTFRRLCGQEDRNSVSAYRQLCCRARYSDEEWPFVRNMMFDWAFEEKDSEAAMFWQAVVMFSSGRKDESVFVLEKIIADDGRFSADAMSLMACIAFLNADNDTGNRWLESCSSKLSDSVKAGYLTAMWCIEFHCYWVVDALLSAALKRDADNVDCLFASSVFAQRERRIPQAKEYLLKAFEKEPENLYVLSDLANIASEEGDWERADFLFRRIVELDSLSPFALKQVALSCMRSGKLEEGESLFTKAVSLSPDDSMCFSREMGEMLSGIVGRNGKSILAAAGLADNYHRIHDICRQYGVRLICMQYPRRSIDALKSIFADDSEGIVFVDNEASFDAAFARGAKYDDLFIDSFAGDFGHGTVRGNAMMAQNAARAVLGLIDRDEDR